MKKSNLNHALRREASNADPGGRIIYERNRQANQAAAAIARAALLERFKHKLRVEDDSLVDEG